ncbi:MAG: 30S ribosomal protein S5 [Candidatus Diapherotrites archaeon]|nr:30S ribosomal protein S5 [Candidatus Diapherotrites archaeon]
MKERALEGWVPKTVTGKLVKSGELTSIEQVWARNLPVIEPEIIDFLLPGLHESVIDTRKTARVNRSGRRFSFSSAVLVGDGNQYIGIGLAADKEKFGSVEKALRKAKLSLVKVNKGCGSWECICNNPHSVPFKVVGKCASVRVNLFPAPKGTGLVVGDHIKNVFRFAGIKDVWCQTRGASTTKFNFVRAAVDALAQTDRVRASNEMMQKITLRPHAREERE